MRACWGKPSIIPGRRELVCKARKRIRRNPGIRCNNGKNNARRLDEPARRRLNEIEFEDSGEQGIQPGGGLGLHALQRARPCPIRALFDAHFIFRTLARRARMASCLAFLAPYFFAGKFCRRITCGSGLHLACQYVVEPVSGWSTRQIPGTGFRLRLAMCQNSPSGLADLSRRNPMRADESADNHGDKAKG